MVMLNRCNRRVTLGSAYERGCALPRAWVTSLSTIVPVPREALSSTETTHDSYRPNPKQNNDTSPSGNIAEGGRKYVRARWWVSCEILVPRHKQNYHYLHSGYKGHPARVSQSGGKIMGSHPFPELSHWLFILGDLGDGAIPVFNCRPTSEPTWLQEIAPNTQSDRLQWNPWVTKQINI